MQYHVIVSRSADLNAALRGAAAKGWRVKTCNAVVTSDDVVRCVVILERPAAAAGALVGLAENAKDNGS